MNNDSTFVPGMEGNNAIPNPYASHKSFNAGTGTYVPGMQGTPVADTSGTVSTSAQTAMASTASSTPIVGFLYSISNGGCTEFWPIHLGANIIGRGNNVDIALNEATVSTRHAQINVKQMRVSHKLIANIQDIGSKRGMFLNDEELDYETHPCKNGDIVTIGDAYKLLIVLIDTDTCGLSAAQNFIPINVETKEDTVVPKAPTPDYPFNPYDMNNNGTIDLSGAMPMGGPGGTLIME